MSTPMTIKHFDTLDYVKKSDLKSEEFAIKGDIHDTKAAIPESELKLEAKIE